jgi:hypothetical protein
VSSEPDEFPNRVLLRRFEGGAVYTAERAGKFYLIKDESSMAGLLDEEDLAGLELVKVVEFDTVSERNKYIREHGLDSRRR